jgi:hypothetical protein
MATIIAVNFVLKNETKYKNTGTEKRIKYAIGIGQKEINGKVVVANVIRNLCPDFKYVENIGLWWLREIIFVRTTNNLISSREIGW